MLNQQELLDKVKVYNNYIDENVVKKAYDFAFPAANPDKKEHFKLGTDRTLAFEDMYNLGDGDFNDIKISFSKA